MVSSVSGRGEVLVFGVAVGLLGEESGEVQFERPQVHFNCFQGNWSFSRDSSERSGHLWETSRPGSRYTRFRGLLLGSAYGHLPEFRLRKRIVPRKSHVFGLL